MTRISELSVVVSKIRTLAWSRKTAERCKCDVRGNRPGTERARTRRKLGDKAPAGGEPRVPGEGDACLQLGAGGVPNKRMRPRGV